ncbi:MAG: RIP metalloprotease RseP, partial [Burkholderiales bacterium]
VLRFSIGFVKPLYIHKSRGLDQTEWVIAALPLGGFVKMLDEREAPVASNELDRAFNRQNVWKRIAIVAAGPIANFLLAIAVYTGLYMVGVTEARPVLGKPTIGSAAERAGVRAGDTIEAINGASVRTWNEARWALLDGVVAKRSDTLSVVDARDAVRTVRLDLSGAILDERSGDPLAQVGLRPYSPPATVGSVLPGGAAALAGLREGDRIRTVAGVPVGDFRELLEAVRANSEKAVAMTVDRAGEQLSLTVTPRLDPNAGRKAVARIGIGSTNDPAIRAKLVIEERYGFFDAIGRGVVKTWDMSVFSLRMLWKMAMGDISWRNLSGPVTIADYAGQSAAMGVLPYLTFIALVSISLGVLNLLPIPILDGGHLLYYAIEVVKGRPVSDRIMELGQRAGMVLLLGLMVFAFYNDINRLLSG